MITAGVIKVKIAVDKIPRPSVYFPPNFSDKRPPGTCVITLKKFHYTLMAFLGANFKLTYPYKEREINEKLTEV